MTRDEERARELVYSWFPLGSRECEAEVVLLIEMARQEEREKAEDALMLLRAFMLARERGYTGDVRGIEEAIRILEVQHTRTATPEEK